MNLHIAPFNLKQIICQVRYKRGYRYLDVCGATMATIEEQYPAWAAQNVSMQHGTMFNEQDSLTLGFTPADMSMTHAMEEIKSGEAIIAATGLLFRLVAGNIKPARFERIGIRFHDFFPCSSCAEAFNFMEQNKLLKHEAVTPLLGSGRPTSQALVARREDETTGIRLQVSVVRRTGNDFADDIAYTELLGTLPKRKLGVTDAPKYGLLADVDVFEKDPLSLDGIADFMKRGMEERQNILRAIAKESV